MTESASEFDLLAVTFIKCKSEHTHTFQELFSKDWLNREWSADDAQAKSLPGQVRPLMLGAAAGYFDFVIVSEATSTYAISKYCMTVLRRTSTEDDRGCMGRLVLDCQSTVAVKVGREV